MGFGLEIYIEVLFLVLVVLIVVLALLVLMILLVIPAPIGVPSTGQHYSTVHAGNTLGARCEHAAFKGGRPRSRVDACVPVSTSAFHGGRPCDVPLLDGRTMGVHIWAYICACYRRVVCVLWAHYACIMCVVSAHYGRIIGCVEGEKSYAKIIAGALVFSSFPHLSRFFFNFFSGKGRAT